MPLTSRLWSKRLPILLAAVLALAACGGGGDGGGDGGGGSGGSAGEGASSTNEVAIDDFLFMPERIEVAPGTTVTWTNREAPEHSVQDEGDLFPESEALGQGESFTFTYDTPGEFPYVCGIHPYMKGTVVVS